VIGFAGQEIEPGQHVHTHNLATEDLRRNSVSGVDVQPVDHVAQDQRRCFMGFKRTE
jgi:altronate hydrolase